MPTASDVVSALAPDHLPTIVFVTAYDQYALRAFEISACDYLLKPFDEERFATTMHRVLALHDQPERALNTALRSLLAQVQHPARQQVVVKTDGRHVFLHGDDIEWVEVSGKELRLHTAQSVIVVREAMNSLERRLDPARFLRVHRSALVNRSYIREVQPWFHGEYVLILRGGERVVTGRSYRDAVHRLIGEGEGEGRRLPSTDAAGACAPLERLPKQRQQSFPMALRRHRIVHRRIARHPAMARLVRLPRCWERQRR